MKRKKRAPNAAYIQVGEAIRAYRLIAGMSQQALADRLDVSFQQVQKYEKGTNRVGAGRLPQIAKILNVPISALFDPHANTSPGASGERRSCRSHPGQERTSAAELFHGHHEQRDPARSGRSGRRDRKGLARRKEESPQRAIDVKRPS